MSTQPNRTSEEDDPCALPGMTSLRQACPCPHRWTTPPPKSESRGCLQTLRRFPPHLPAPDPSETASPNLPPPWPPSPPNESPPRSSVPDPSSPASDAP